MPVGVLVDAGVVRLIGRILSLLKIQLHRNGSFDRCIDRLALQLCPIEVLAKELRHGVSLKRIKAERSAMRLDIPQFLGGRLKRPF